MARECQNPAPKDTPQSAAKIIFLPGDAFAQLHNLSSYMLFDGAYKTVVERNSDPKHPEFIGLILGPTRGLTDTGAQQPVVGSSAALRWCDRLLKRHGLVPVDVTPSNMIATCGGIGTAKVVQVLDFPAGIVGCERSDAIPGARGAHVDRWKTTVHSTVDTTHDHAPVGRPRNDPHREVGQRAIWTRAQSADFFFRDRRLGTARQLARPAQA